MPRTRAGQSKPGAAINLATVIPADVHNFVPAWEQRSREPQSCRSLKSFLLYTITPAMVIAFMLLTPFKCNGTRNVTAVNILLLKMSPFMEIAVPSVKISKVRQWVGFGREKSGER